MVIAEVDVMDSSYSKKVGGNSGPSPITRPSLGPSNWSLFVYQIPVYVMFHK